MIPAAILLLSAFVADPKPLPVIIAPQQIPPGMQVVLDNVAIPPRPRVPIERLVTPMDYPASAPRVHGTFVARLWIDKQGKVVDCQVQHSSDSTVVDTATCGLMRRRATFTTAVDRNGNVSIGLFTALINWDEVFKRFPSFR